MGVISSHFDTLGRSLMDFPAKAFGFVDCSYKLDGGSIFAAGMGNVTLWTPLLHI